MRKYLVRGIEIFHGFLLLSALYCCIMQQISSSDMKNFLKSLLLIPLVGILSVTVEKVKYFWQYFLIAVIAVALAAAAAGNGYARIWMVVCGVIAAFSYFFARAGKKECWLESPALPWLVLYLVMYLIGNNLKREFLIWYASFGAGIYYLVCNLHTNLTEMDEFVRTHNHLERLPVKRLGKINGRMMWMQSGVIAAAMFTAPFVGIDQIIRQMGRALRKIVMLLLSLLPSGSSEELVEETTKNAQQMMMGGGEEVSAFWALIYKILDIIGWMIAAFLVLLTIWMILKKIYDMYRQFNVRTEENGDRIERLIAPPVGEKKRVLERKKKENLFWDRSPDARIRKYYKKRVLKDLKAVPELFWTPTQLEENVVMSREEKEKFHFYYEKARYGKQECTKEDMQNMMKLR